MQEKSDDRQLKYKPTEDGVLVITCGNYSELWNQASQATLRELGRENSDSKQAKFMYLTALHCREVKGHSL